LDPNYEEEQGPVTVSLRHRNPVSFPEQNFTFTVSIVITGVQN